MSDPLEPYMPKPARHPLKRCAVCGYRGWFHWIVRAPFYNRSIIGDPPPRRGWFR